MPTSNAATDGLHPPAEPSKLESGPKADGAPGAPDLPPLRLSVVGHVNTGKTSLISTLARRTDLPIADGRTTTRLQDITFRIGREELLVLVDTPGFELVSDLILELETDRAERAKSGARADDFELLQALLERARADGRNELELDLRALEAALAADVVLYVVDVTQPPLERLRDEVSLLVKTARPVVAVLNFVAEPRSHADEWREIFRRENVHAQVAFDVMASDPEAEAELFRTITTVVPDERRPAIRRLQRAHRGEALQHRAAAVRVAAELLLDAACLRVSKPKDGPGDPREQARAELERRLRERERDGLEALGRAHGFTGTEVRSGELGSASDLFNDDLFSPEALKQHAPGLLGLTAGGAAVGATADLMLGGLSFGIGAVLGGAAGLLSGVLRRAIEVNRRGDQVVARASADVFWLLLGRVLAAHEAYASRSHARRDVVELEDAGQPLQARAEARELCDLLRRAGSDRALCRDDDPSPKRRAEVLESVERALSPLLP